MRAIIAKDYNQYQKYILDLLKVEGETRDYIQLTRDNRYAYNSNFFQGIRIRRSDVVILDGAYLRKDYHEIMETMEQALIF